MTSDHFSVRAVIFILGLAGLVAVASMVFLAMTHTAIPDQLDRIATFSLGVLSGILAQTRTPNEPVEVQVSNPSTDPVQVEEADA